jgi:hypothetical protein
LDYVFFKKFIPPFFALKFFQLKFLKRADYIHCASLEEANSVKKLSKDIKTIILPFGVNDNFINRNVDYTLKKKALLNSNFKIFFASSLKLIWKYIFIKLIGFFILRQLN